MERIRTIDRALLFLFAFSSGLFKVAGALTHRGDAAAWWEADNHVFAHLGMGLVAVALFGVVQAAAAVALWPRRTRAAGAWALVGCNAFATLGLFVAHVQPFGVVSLLFVAMALLAVPAGRSLATRAEVVHG